MFSIELVQASERRLCRTPRRLTVHLVEPFKDVGGDTGRLPVDPAGEIAQQPLSLVGIVEFPSLPECPTHRRMQWLGQPLDRKRCSQATSLRADAAG